MLNEQPTTFNQAVREPSVMTLDLLRFSLADVGFIKPNALVTR